MIIAWYMRLPMKPFTFDPTFSGVGALSDKWRWKPPESALKKSMDLYWKELKTADIGHCVTLTRVVPEIGISEYNDEAIKTMAQFPGKFSGFAAIDPRDVPKAIDEIERCMNLGFKGILLDVNMARGIAEIPAEYGPPSKMLPPFYPDDARFNPIFEKCQKMGVPLMMTFSPRVGPDISYNHPVHVDHITASFPKLTLIIAMGCWPHVNEICAVAWKRPNLYISPNVYFINMPGNLHYVEAANIFLEDRFLFGIAYPELPIVQSVETFKKLPFRPEVLEKVLYKNSAKLLGL